MSAGDRAVLALRKANQSQDDLIARSLWLAKAVDHVVADRAVLVGGTAVNLHTGSYRPTDIDMCAYIDQSDRNALVGLGLRHTQGDHFAYEFDDGEVWLVEFPDTQVDGDISTIHLSPDDHLSVISRESLIVDRLLQATDQTGVTFDEAVRLCVAVYQEADWEWVGNEIGSRDLVEPGLGLEAMFARVLDEVRSLTGR